MTRDEPTPFTGHIPSKSLPNGVSIPQLGFGTYKVNDDVKNVVLSALHCGYRHIDTAQMYHNEAEVGAALNEFGLPRGDVFVTSKLDNCNHEPDDARRSFEQSLTDLRTDYVDLFLIHWPLPSLYGGDFVTTWQVLEEFYADGRARAIGVSNFQINHLQAILDGADMVPMVNQIESHPFLVNQELHDFHSAHGIVTEAWSPLARGAATSDPTLAEIGEAHGVSASQVALRWALQRGDIIFPKSITPSRQAENIRLFDFALTDDEMARIFGLDRGEEGRTGSHPDTMNRL